MKGKFNFLTGICFLFIFGSCKTDDVKPIVLPDSGSLVSLSFNTLAIAEAGGSAELTATLTKVSTNDVEVKLLYTGKATFGQDYSSNLTLIIPAGNISNSTNLLAIQDTIKEGIEDIKIAVDTVFGGGEDGIQVININIEDDDVPSIVNLILNEILYDPSNVGLDGDANGDGVYTQAGDEFIELINYSTKVIDLSGYKIFDAGGLASGTPNHLIPAGTILQPQKALVIFGGGTPTGSFGGALIQKSTSGDLNLNNAGDVLTVKDTADNVVLTYDITPLSDNPNESYTRNPDLLGDFIQHSQIPSTKKYSPGTKIDGTSF